MTPVRPAGAGDVAWPERRQDVVNALETLATLRPEDSDVWPDLRSAVDWLVNDTSWDTSSPAEEIGLLLRDDREADAVSAVVGPLVALIDDEGPFPSDADCLSHPRWPVVREQARLAWELLRRPN